MICTASPVLGTDPGISPAAVLHTELTLAFVKSREFCSGLSHNTPRAYIVCNIYQRYQDVSDYQNIASRLKEYSSLEAHRMGITYTRQTAAARFTLFIFEI